MFAVPESHRGLSASQAAAAGRFAALVLAACAGTSFALEPRAVAEPQPGRLQVTASTLPRLDNVDASRLDMTLSPARRGIGFALGITSQSAPVSGSFPPNFAAAPTVDLGLHWRYTLDSNYRFDVTAWRRVQNADAISMIQSHDPSYGARVEMGLGSPSRLHKGFVADRGFLGVQLESGARLGVKRSNRAPMLYYRNNF
jgi:hypothetical protein